MPRLVNNTLQFFLFVFLFLQVIPLLKRESMQVIVILDYSIVLSLIFIISIKMKNWENPFKYFSMLALVFLSFILFGLGFSGSIAGFIISATLPYFLFNRVYSNEDIVRLFFVPIKWASIFLIIFGAILFYNLRNDLLNINLMIIYFIKSSINYVSLLFHGFSVLYFIMYELKKKSLKPPTKIDFIVGLILILSCVIYSSAYWTRSTFMTGGFLLFLYVREYKVIIYSTIIVGIIVFKDSILNYLSVFIGVGASMGELAVQDVRADSVNYLINNAIAFNYDFTNTMSYSSLMNLFFCLFPFTLLFVLDVIFSIINIFMIRNLYISLLYGFIFVSALFITIYQMDFLSIFVLFFMIQVIVFENKKKEYSKLIY